VLIKGGHRYRTASGSERDNATTSVDNDLGVEATDILDNNGEVKIFRGEWIDAPKLRGSGCILSAAIAAGLGRGMALEGSIREAKGFVSSACRSSA
jgi:hydroxymethylpyrimidine/phosphomethylpyrimidine kinase